MWTVNFAKLRETRSADTPVVAGSMKTFKQYQRFYSHEASDPTFFVPLIGELRVESAAAVPTSA
jgi:hypothetical protein